MKKALLGLGLCLVMAGGGRAERAPALSVGDAAPDLLHSRLGRGEVEERYIASVLATLRAADIDHDGLEEGDIVRLNTQRRAQHRASRVGQVLAFDLDGDLRVTRAELEAPGMRPGSNIAQTDANGDGVLTIEEAAAAAEADGRQNSQDDTLRALLGLDPNRDGRLTVRELEGIARRVFAQADLDSNTVISEDEFAASQKRHAEMAQRARCQVPPPSSREQVVVIGAYEGSATADVTFAGQDEETSAATLIVEPGARPLYVVLASYDPMIWRVAGARSRISRVVTSSYGKTPAGLSASGVEGVASDRITSLKPGCLDHFYPEQTSDGRGSGETGPVRAARQTKTLLGREAEVVTGGYQVRSVSIPSGRVAKPEGRRATAAVPAGFDPTVWATHAVRFQPDGLMRFDPRDVGGPGVAQRYEVLPQGFGLAQLVASGALKVTDNRVFHIMRPIPRFPAGLNGAHGVVFELPPGVPRPGGSPGHSNVRRAGEASPSR